MAQRPRNRYRWPIALAEVVLLHAVFATASIAAPTAADPAASTATAGIAADPVGDPADAVSGADGGDLYLEAVVNGANKGLARFGLRDGEIYATVATLEKLGFHLPLQTPDPVRLTLLSGVHVAYDAGLQKLSIDAPLKLLDLPHTVLNAPPNSVPKATTSPGVLLNYDIYSTVGEHDTQSVNTFAELRAFNSLGVFSTTALSQTTRSDGQLDQNSVRLDTTWTTSFPEQLLALRIGDVLTGALSWSRSTRIGGIQFGTDFALQPYRITTPLPALFGSATLPSDVQLYINGVRQYSGSVPAGPFQLNTIPTLNGAGNAQVVLTDALGRATTLNFSLYDSRELLAQGLAEWSGEVGYVRKSYGLDSFDYGHDPAGSGTWRYGVSNSLTLEAHAEATAGLANAGAGGSWLLGQAGVVSAAYAHSDLHGRSGSLVSLDYDWRNDRFSFLIGGSRTSGAYADVATLYGGAPSRISAHGLLSYNTDALGSFGIGYVHLRSFDQPASRFGNAYWFKSLGRAATFNVSVNQNLDISRDRSFFASVTFALDRGTSLSVGASHEEGRNRITADANHPTPNDEGFGWRADVEASPGQNGGQAELDYLGRYGRVATGVSALGDSRFAYFDYTGALVFMGGHLFAARHVDDAFALVSTEGVPGVPVKLENRPIGTTDANGLLLVTPLNSYQNNQVAIDPMSLPADVRIDHVKTLATPGDRSGTLVRFGITPVRAASIILVDAEQKPLPLGSEVRLEGKSGEPALVGFDGIVYIDTLDIHNVLSVEINGGKCHAAFDYQKSSEGIALVGPLVCH